jgi:uncharacterized protein YjbJ (UPF0337 family)
MASGTKDKAKGRLKKAIGDLTNDPEMRRRGQVDEDAGTLKNGIEKGIDKVKEKLNK